MATINIGGKEREYDLSTGGFIIAFENEGVRVRALDFENPAVDEFIPRLAWIGLLPADPELKEATVRQWFVDGDFDYEQLFDAISEGAEAIGDIMTRLDDMVKKATKQVLPTKQVPYRSPERAAKKARHRRKKGRK